MIEDNNAAYGVSKHYVGENGKQYFEQQNIAAQHTVKFKAELFSRYIGNEDSVLDFGCGGGMLLAQLNAKRKIGIEINPMARQYASTLGITTYATVNEITNERFTRIISSHALEHVPSPYHALMDLRHLLNDNGLFIWLSPLDDWRAHYNRHWNANDHHMHLYGWTPQLMGNLLVTAGYEPLQIEVITRAWPPRLGARLWQFPRPIFELFSYWSARLLKRRQLLAVARKQQG